MILEAIYAGVIIGDFVYHRLYPDRPKPPVRLRLIPRTDEGATVPLLFGTCRVRTPILASATNIGMDTAASAGLGGDGFIYSADLFFVLGIPLQGDTVRNEVIGMWVGEKKLGWDDFVHNSDHGHGAAPSTPIIVGGDAFPPDIGPISGTAEVFNGKSDQELLDPVTLVTSTAAGERLVDIALVNPRRIPGFRGYLSVFLYNGGVQGFYFGSNATPPAINFEAVSRFDPTASAAYRDNSREGLEECPTSCIRAILVDTLGKLGLDPSYIDDASFLTASTTLNSEVHGYSRSIEDTEDATQVINDILAQIDGVIFEDPVTNTIKVKLIRQDYVIGLVPDINPSNCQRLEGYSNGGWRNTTNQVIVTFTDRENNYADGSASSKNLANAVGSDGQSNPVTLHMAGIHTRALAEQVAARELAVRSRPVAKCRAVVDRSFWTVTPGDPVTVTWPEYNLTNVAFRVANVDRGMPGSEEIVLDLIQDVFGAAVGDFTGPTSTPFPRNVDPLTNRFFSEAPRYWAQQAADAALITNADIPRTFAFAEPDDLASKFDVQTRAEHPILVRPFRPDIPLHVFPTYFTLGDGYARTLEPYDTTTGLLIQDVTGPVKEDLDGLGGLAATPTQISASGLNMICIARTDGEHEFMCFESSTSIGGGQYLLNNVWRGLLDTPAIEFVGDGTERGWFVSTADIGRLGYGFNAVVDAQLIPRLFTAIGSGEEETDSITIVNRAASPYPPADLTIGGEALTGTIGTPGTAGFYKLVSFLEESFEVYGHERDRLSPTVTRGDAVDETLNDFSTTGYAVYEAGQLSLTAVNPSYVYYPFDGSLVVSAALDATAGGLLIDGYGSLSVVALARRTLAVSDPLIGVSGLQQSQLLEAWRTPAIAVFAPSWRNLLANPRFNYDSGSAEGWTVEIATGAITIGTGTFSLSRLATGNGSHYLQAADPTVVRAQVVLVKRWLPRGMTAIFFGYFRNENADADDTVTIEADALQEFAHALLSSGTSVVTPPTANWGYREVALTGLPAGTALLSAKMSFINVAAGGTANADSRATELGMCLGQIASDTTTLLANPSFDSAATTSWTVDSGGFVTPATIASPSSFYVQGGAFASSVIHQDFTLPTGYEYSTAVLRFFRAQTLANDAGTVKVDVLDGGGSVIATATTGSEQMTALNVWYRRMLYVDTPDGAAKIRVTFTALRSLGSGNSGACFDEANLMVTKRLDAAHTTALTFDTPTVQKMPATWQEHHVAYPTLAAGLPDYVFGGSDFNGKQMTWSDSLVHTTGKLCGQFGDGVTSVDAYAFTRAASVHLKATGSDAATIGAYSLASSFTCLVHFRVDEPGFAAIAGIVGRMSTSRGWGISLTAAGQLQAIMRGTGATSKTVASGRVVSEGGMHTAALVYDSALDLLYIYDEQGLGASVSTAAGLGEISDVSTDTDTFLKIGRDAADHDTLPGQIGRVYIWNEALSAADIALHCTYAKDPTGLVTTYTRTAAAVVPMAADSAGATACVMSAAQFALAYSSILTLDSGTGYGLAVGKSTTSIVPSFDFTNGTYWSKDASATLTQSVVDMTGRPRGVTVVGDASNGLNLQAVTVSATATINLVFWARASTGTPTLNVVLKSSAGVVKQTLTAALTTLWQRFTLKFTSWDGATAACKFQFISASGALTFDLGGVLWAAQTTEVPAIFPAVAAGTHGDYNASVTTSLQKQLNYEGELVAEGVGMIDVPVPTAGTLVRATIGTNANLRELQVLAGAGGFRGVHYDSVPAATNASSAYSTYSSRCWKARARWAQCGLLDNVAGPPFSSVAWTDDTHATPTVAAGRVAAWTITATNLTTIKIGTGTAAPSDVVLRSVTVRTREEKLI